MVNITINNEDYQIESGISILDACKIAGTFVPRFCYHETLSIAGNCRMCLVEIEGIEKPIASCLTEVSNNMVVYTESIFAKKARENVIETLLLNHPLDCPICDQAGECDLQDQTKTFGSNYSKYYQNKRGVEDKNCGTLIKTIMTRCIHCTRCVRFSSEIAGVDFFGTFNRGTSTEIGGYTDGFFKSEISGNVIDLCPVGALTSKPVSFKARPWELHVNETVDMTDSTGSNLYVYFKEDKISRILPKINHNINDSIITDMARFSYDSNHIGRQKYISIIKNKKKSKVNWYNFLLNTDRICDKKDNKTLFNINENIGLEAMNTLNTITRKLKNVRVSSLSGKIKTTNSYFWGMSDKIKDIDNCDSLALSFSVNTKVECPVVNVRLRTRCQNSLLSLISMDRHYPINLPNFTVNINLQRSLGIIEGKNCKYSSTLNSSVSPLSLIGDSLKKRGLGLVSLFSFLKETFFSMKVLKINSSANSEALDLFNVNYTSNRRNEFTNALMCVNSENTLKVRRILAQKFSTEKPTFWFNTHTPRIECLSSVIPLLSEYEENRMIMNLEQRPQQTNNTFQTHFDGRSFKNVLNSIYMTRFRVKRKAKWFLYEIVKTPWIFDTISTNFSTLNATRISKKRSINYLFQYTHEKMTVGLLKSVGIMSIHKNSSSKSNY